MPRPDPIVVAHPGAELYGSDRVLLDSVIGMLADAHPVVVVLPEEGPLADALRDAGARVRVEPAFVLRKRLMKPAGWGEALRSGWRGARAVRRVLRDEQPSAVFVNTITLPLWPVLSRVMRLPVVLHVHEGESAAPTAVKKVLYAPALCATRILVNSVFSRRVMASAYRRLDRRARLIPNAVPGPTAVTGARASLEGHLRIVFVGRLSPRKGPDLVVEAARLLHERGVECSVSLVGAVFEGYEWFEQELRERIAASGLGDRITLHGFHADVWSFIADSDVLVVPSRLDEPFGNTAVEGVLAGRPVVVSDTSGLREATAGIPTAFRVQADSASGLADGLQRVVDDWPQVVAATDDARRMAEERHSPTRYRERIAAALAGL